MIVTIPKESIDESLLPTLTFYHGSTKKFDKILPNSFSAGNKLRGPEWAVFMFGEKRFAKIYAMSLAIKDKIKSLKRRQTEFPPTLGWFERTGLNDYEIRGVAMDKNYDELEELSIGLKYYVYTLEVPINSKLSLVGTTNSLPEYTYAGNPKVLKRDEYIITKEDFEKAHKRVSKEEYDRIHKDKPWQRPIQNKIFRMMLLPQEKREECRRIAIKMIQQGDLKPGDDLSVVDNPNIYHRVTWKGIGIYEALRQNTTREEWQEILKNPAINWLPKPPEYGKDYISYFTRKGFGLYQTKAKAVMKKYLDFEYAEMNLAVIDPKDIVYKDKYQVVVNKKSVREETDIMINESVSDPRLNKKYNSFMEFCRDFNTPEEVMSYYKYHHVTWPEGKSNDRSFSWPDDILRTFEGNCWDHAIFFYYFCKNKGIPARLYRIAIFAEPAEGNDGNRWWCMGHMVTACKCSTGWCICNYGRTPNMGMYGPFKTEREAMESYTKEYQWMIKTHINKNYQSGYFANITKPYYCTDEKQYALYRKYWNRHDIQQNDVFAEKILRLPYDGKVSKYTLMGALKNKLKKHLGSLYDKIGSIFESSSINSNEITSSKLPYKCEVKMCHQNYNNGNPRPSAKPTPQLILHKDGKNWRVRAEMLLFKEGKLYLVKQNKVNQYGVTYKLPGGGIDDPQEGIEETASRECKEEARIIPTNVVYTGVEVQHIYDKIPEWHKAILHPEGIYYDGSMTFICTGEYKQEYKSYVKKMDQQDEMTKGHFYTYEQVEGILSKEHKALFKKYLKDYRRIQFMKEEFIPEIDRSFLDMDISCLVEDKK